MAVTTALPPDLRRDSLAIFGARSGLSWLPHLRWT